MAWEQVKKTKEDELNEKIWELWLWAEETLNPHHRVYFLIRELAEPQIDSLNQMIEDNEDEK